MKKWEYKLAIAMTYDEAKLKKELNDLVQQGWELCAANFLQDGVYSCFFKREVVTP